MKTTTENNKSESRQTVKYFTVSGDILMDILHVLASNDIRYEIKSINRHENSILLSVPHERQPAQLIRGIDNIETILASYREYITGLPPDAAFENAPFIF